MSTPSRSIIAKILLVVLSFNLVPQVVWAGDITDRSLTLSSSAAGASNVNYTFNLTVPSDTIIEAFSAQICTTAYNSCTTPTGFDAGSASLLSQPTGFGDSSGWSADSSDAGKIRMQNSTNSTAPGSSQSVTFDGVTNPSNTNATFFARLTTYSNADYTGEIDTGVVAASTAEQVQLTGTVPPILTFCVGTSISSDCSTASGNSIDFGQFSPESTSSATSQMRANTNGSGGYVITVRGTTLTSGTDSIPALSTQTASTTGTSQFGMNLRNNTTPNVGTDPTGDGIGTYHSNYGTVDEFRFADGDTVAQAAEETNSNTFTSSYIVNIEPKQAAGTYSTTLTYICTATF